MNKTLPTILLSLLFLFDQHCHGGETTQREELYRNLVPHCGYCSDSLDNAPLKHQEVANFFGYNMQKGITPIVSYTWGIVGGEETVFQIAWYADGYVVTHINGDKKGLQTVVRNDEIIGISYPSGKSEEFEDTSINKYSWGYVLTAQWWQNIIWYPHSDH